MSEHGTILVNHAGTEEKDASTEAMKAGSVIAEKTIPRSPEGAVTLFRYADSLAMDTGDDVVKKGSCQW